MAAELKDYYFCMEDKKKIPSIHRRNWKLIENELGTYLLHVPSSTLLRASMDIVGSSHCSSSCPLCSFEKQVQVPEKMPVKFDISAIALNVIESCNLRCTYCFAGDGDYGKPSEMGLQLAQQAIKFFTRERASLHIVFFGGEPLLNFKLIAQTVEWCESQSDKSFSYALTTNGVLLRETMLSFFKKYKFALTVSYDGKYLQDKQRLGTRNQLKLGLVTEKKLERYSDALSQLKSVKIRSTVTVKHLSETFINIIMSLSSLAYQFAYARASVSHESSRFTRGDVEKLNNILREVVDYYLEKKEFAALMRISNIRKFVKMIHQGDYHRNFCGAGINYLSVSTTGNFYLCHRFTEDEEESFGSIENGLNVHKLREVNALRMNLIEPCKSCWMRNFCGGGCFHEHKLANNTITKVDPIFCLLQEAELQQSMRVYLHLQNEAPELLE